MNEPADLDRLVQRIHRDLRLERARADPAEAAIQEKLRHIRGRTDRSSMSRFLLIMLASAALLLALTQL